LIRNPKLTLPPKQVLNDKPRSVIDMQLNKAVADEVQAPPPDPDEKMSRKEHARFVFQWLNGIAADKTVSSAAFRVAYVISQCVNWKTGEAFPSTDTIAARAGMVQSTVREAIKLLDETGHMAVALGSRGRGHPNKYRPIVKGRAVAIFDPQKNSRAATTAATLDVAAKERFGRLKERSDDVKGRTVAMNH
jgi:hypothetical protein